MATLTTYAAGWVDMRFTSPLFSSFQVTYADSSQIWLSFGTEQIVFRGSFFYNAAGTALTGGTVTQYDEYDNGIIELSLTGVSVPALTAYAYYVANDPSSLAATALAGNDLINSNSSFAGNDFLLGYNGNDTINAYSGDDYLDGGAGNDVMNGGLGNDIYVVDSTLDVVNESTGQGTDTVQSWIPWVLGSNLENLTLLGSASYGVGNELANVITGNGVDNPLLRGNGGADTIYGGAGNDWIDGESGNDPLPGGHVAGNDVLYGEAGDDTILAGDGNDVLYGGSGTDFLVGEVGNDLIYGGSEWDAIDGRQGSDVLYGEGGADIIFGDGYFYLFGFANDTLYGGDDNDIMMGEAGEPSMSGADDVLYGQNGNDLLDGGGGNDVIYGGNGNDIIDGDHGNDYIVGGQGAEIMLGSAASVYGTATAGGDLFAYLSMDDAGDRIWGFDLDVAAGSDGIDLRLLFDVLDYTGNDPRADGYLYVLQNGPNTDIYVDANGAAGGVNLGIPLLSLMDVNAVQVTDNYLLFQ